METGYTRLTVFFEDPFWVCLYERGGGGAYEVCRVVFGAEPRDGEVYAFLLEHWRQLRFSPAVRAERETERSVSPKRRQREIRRQVEPHRPGTRAQQALQLQREQGRAAARKASRRQREEEQARQYALRREKQREKHRGH